MRVILSFVPPPFNSHGLVGWGLRSVGGSYSQRRCWYACQRKKTSVRKFTFFRASTVFFSRKARMWGKGCRCLSTISGDAFRIHANGSGGRVRRAFFPFALSSFNTHRLGAGMRTKSRRVLHSMAALSVCMPGGREDECAGNMFISNFVRSFLTG